MFCATLSRERATKKEGCHIETEEKKAAGVIERREEKNRHIIGCLLPSSLPLSLFPPSGRQPLPPLIYSYSANLDHLPPNKCLSTSRNGKKEFYIRCVSSSTSLPNYAYACKQRQEAQTTADFHYPSRSSIMSRRLFISFLLLLDPLSYPRG